MLNRFTPIAVAAVLLVAGATSGGAEDMADAREPVRRTEAEKAFVLEQMRLFLTSITEIEADLGAGDMGAVAREAAARGRKANVGLARPPSLAAKESDVWRSMIGKVRGGFDAIAEQAAAHAPAEAINRTLGETMRNCVACHQSYRIEVETH